MDSIEEMFLIFEKEEYEMNFFGFTIRDFKRENIEFFQKQVDKSIKFISSKFIELTKSLKPEVAQRITDATKSIEEKIINLCQPNIEKIVNEEVEKSLFIPDNVIFPGDRAQLKPITAQELSDLEKECDELTITMQQNTTFLHNLKKELAMFNIEEHLKNEDELLKQAEYFLEQNTLCNDLSSTTQIILSDI